jgi:ATP-dependent Clp protease adapter protein ClpS
MPAITTTQPAFSAVDFDRALLGATYVDVRNKLYATSLVAMLDGASVSDVTESIYSGMAAASLAMGIARAADMFKREAAKKDEAARLASCHKAANVIVRAASIMVKEYETAILATLRGCNSDDDAARAAHLATHMKGKPWGSLDGAEKVREKNKKAKQRAKAREMEAAGETVEGQKAERAVDTLAEHGKLLDVDTRLGVILAMVQTLNGAERESLITSLVGMREAIPADMAKVA